MHGVITHLLIFSLLRLQFVCCCGSVVPLEIPNNEVLDAVENCTLHGEAGHVKSCRTKHKCKEARDIRRTVSPTHKVNEKATSATCDVSAASTDSVTCESCCNCDHAHKHHLHGFSSAKNLTNPKVNLDSLVLFHSVPSSKFTAPMCCGNFVTKSCLSDCAISILVLLGQLRI